jgi:hypothetical protein
VHPKGWRHREHREETIGKKEEKRIYHKGHEDLKEEKG